jgi:cell division protein FtsL
MTEYFTVKRIDNSRLSRPVSAAQFGDFRRKLLVGGAMAGLLLSYAWQHFECIQIRYQLEQLSSERAQARELNRQLHLEIATLRSPMRVDAIARNQLGLTVPVPGLSVPAETAGDSVLADARPVAQPNRP